MKTTAVTPADIAASVWAVPPLALDWGGGQNARLAAHIEAGGVSTLLWGGNANIYAMTREEYAGMIARIPGWVSENAWAIPSAGPDFGKLREHADILRGSGFPAVMLLPMTGPNDPDGTEAAVRDFVRRSGIPAILYLRSAGYLRPEQIAALMDEGLVVALKYAVETGDLSRDATLDEILALVARERIVSGIGEIAAITHLRTFGLAGFTAGAVCIAPRRAMAVLRALQGGEFDTAIGLVEAIRPLEELRIAHGPVRVIHDAVTQSGVADMGRLTPHLSHAPGLVQDLIRAAVGPLLQLDAAINRPV